MPAPTPTPGADTAAPPPEAHLPEPESVSKALDETVDTAVDWTGDALTFVQEKVLTLDVALELSILFAVGVIAYTLARPGKQLLARVWPATEAWRLPTINMLRQVVINLVAPLIAVVLLWFSASLLSQLGHTSLILTAAASLLNAWIVIRLFSALVPDPFWSKAFATVAWIIAALNILQLLDPTVAFLDSIALRLGDMRLSLYLILKALLFAALLLWLASLVAGAVNSRIKRTGAFTPSVRTLIGQTVRLGLLTVAIMIAVNAVGVDLTALTVLFGGIGVGIGFGLQSVFSNLVAGIILLSEKSIKVGDFIELPDGTRGSVREITIRSTLITTNDNIDVLVPNSEFISKQMTNWTLRDAFRRLRIPFGVAYGSDKELVRKAGLEAAEEVSHTLLGVKGREPKVWLVGFGDSSLDFELVVWLQPEAVLRPAAVNADYCWAIESALRKYEIEIPFPQRDLHIRSGQLPIVQESKEQGGEEKA
ncbi:mechanosensitive ion channel domain-containing protein [Methyloligella sp. 2.7D]|uniref:mechanosensitive ion channel family protein n=1 Tax=unclassified Methyloligella TaxID=2625955 RepID=UPI00157D9CF5|nr:mechanosensitive ion channel domain-containing protein [Methyloligella sp. GL2]QKP77280.1 mechanosensitive ion channel [Methyloligella sp. GL2]